VSGDLDPLIDILAERRAARLHEYSMRCEHRRLALLRPEARAEFDAAMAQPEPETVPDDEVFLEAVACARDLGRKLPPDDAA
jgi:hypothetical protein